MEYFKRQEQHAVLNPFLCLPSSPHDKVDFPPEEKPGQASITSTEADVHANSLTVRWTAPADDGGSPITAYRVIILKGDTKKDSVNIVGLPKTYHNFTGLERDANYTVQVFARNSVFEGDAAVKTLKTKFEGPPEVVKIDKLPIKTKDDTITLKWKEPGKNGKVITHYTAYQRTVTDGKVGDWKEIGKITNVKVRLLKVKLKKGEVYEIAITATNALGEGLKQGAARIKIVKPIGKDTFGEIPIMVVLVFPGPVSCRVGDNRYVSSLSEEVVEVHFKDETDYDPISPNLKIFVACFSTRWTRLYDAMDVLQERVLYNDRQSSRLFLEHQIYPLQPFVESSKMNFLLKTT
ncbi:Twitchin [Stylophora pistillata]|uniref:Twitchin n=1 Tax=Stylophora pistillata TaxID=50429 RepID=A0A2B4S5X8_STYPI|nr:Twitchin [Stylophora pistillata]